MSTDVNEVQEAKAWSNPLPLTLVILGNETLVKEVQPWKAYLIPLLTVVRLGRLTEVNAVLL